MCVKKGGGRLETSLVYYGNDGTGMKEDSLLMERVKWERRSRKDRTGRTGQGGGPSTPCSVS